MKNIKKQEMLYNAVSGMDEGNVADFIKTENTLSENGKAAGTYSPVPRILGAFAACIVIFGGMFAGLKYLEYTGGAAAGQPEASAPAETEATADTKTPSHYRIAKKTRTVSGSTATTVYEYDELGRLIKETESSQSGTQSQTIEYTYDNFGNLIKTYTDHKYAGKQRTVTEDEREYSAEGRLISKYVKTTSYMNSKTCGTSVYTEKYEYDERGRVVRMEQQTDAAKSVYEFMYTDENGSYILTGPGPKVTVTFNEKGLMIKSVSEINSEERIAENEYDEHGKLTKTTVNGELQSECSYTYDGDVVIREDQTSYVAGSAEKTCLTYKYDEENNVIEYTVSSENGAVVDKTVYEWEID